MTMPDTRSGRPNTSGTRGGQAQVSPLPLAEEQYSKDNEQKFRRQLMDIISPLQQQLSGTASAISALVASAISNDSSVSGATVKDALQNLQLLDADLTAIAALAPSNDDVIQRKASAWTNRTMAQLAADLVTPLDTTFLTDAAAAAAYQPLDADLTAIAALATDSFGRDLLTKTTAAAGFDYLAPSTTRGDLIARGASSNGRVAVGSVGQVLATDGADPAWRGGMTLLASGAVSAAATLDLVLTSYTGYRGLVFFLSGFLPVTDGVGLYMRFSTDGGVTYDASGYNYTGMGTSDAPASAAFGSGSAAQIQLTGASLVGNASTEGLNGEIKLLNQTSTAFWSRVTWHTTMIDNQATPAGNMHVGSGAREAAQDTDAVRFLFSSGNIAAGNYAVYGLS